MEKYSTTPRCHNSLVEKIDQFDYITIYNIYKAWSIINKVKDQWQTDKEISVYVRGLIAFIFIY